MTVAAEVARTRRSVIAALALPMLLPSALLPSALLLPALVPSALRAQDAGPLPFDAGWTVTGKEARIESWRGAPALRMRNGGAARPDARFRDGTIEFDLVVTGDRSFVYLRFRLDSAGDGEELYFRPHKSSLPDAVQYTPSWNGESNWQLYHGAQGTAPVTLRPDRWLHVRVVVRDRRMALYFDRADTAVLLVPLAREPAGGGIAFATFTPAASTAPPGEPVAAVANVFVRPDSGEAFPAAEPAPVPDGLVRRWQLSPAWATDTLPLDRLPDSLSADASRWPAYSVEPHGVLVIGRHLRRPAERSAAVARLVVRAERAGLHRLDLGFSDYVTVFVGRRPVFAGDAHYSFDRPRQEGLIGLSQATLWLPLARGDNELLFAVTDEFGGWGLMARLGPAGSARVVAPAP